MRGGREDKQHQDLVTAIIRVEERKDNREKSTNTDIQRIACSSASLAELLLREETTMAMKREASGQCRDVMDCSRGVRDVCLDREGEESPLMTETRTIPQSTQRGAMRQGTIQKRRESFVTVLIE